ncbi:hypothetical protein QBC34DRAFT_474673 [Podospora aff. communis PSN243]|uniref:Uncharacterized protein n=1 Tax=Podospora aff. communis PSN243 TaxID=3040156 RepID=A0AAV9GB00_9PEZI|nr:hypothetical protein QBC34DRAFT_474673 [Podospora aff. communis PSN243]
MSRRFKRSSGFFPTTHNSHSVSQQRLGSSRYFNTTRNLFSQQARRVITCFNNQDTCHLKMAIESQLKTSFPTRGPRITSSRASRDSPYEDANDSDSGYYSDSGYGSDSETSSSHTSETKGTSLSQSIRTEDLLSHLKATYKSNLSKVHREARLRKSEARSLRHKAVHHQPHHHHHKHEPESNSHHRRSSQFHPLHRLHKEYTLVVAGVKHAAELHKWVKQREEDLRIEYMLQRIDLESDLGELSRRDEARRRKWMEGKKVRRWMRKGGFVDVVARAPRIEDFLPARSI